MRVERSDLELCKSDSHVAHHISQAPCNDDNCEKKIMISIIVPTRWIWDFTKLANLLKSLDNQTMQPEEILIIIDFDIPKKPLQTFLWDCHVTYHISLRLLAMTRVVCQDGYGVSAARNRWLKTAKWEYCLICDDDIVFDDERSLERMMDECSQLKLNAKAKKNDTIGVILYPTILFHDTGNIQTQWFTDYNRLMSWPVPKFGVDRKSKLRRWFPKWLVNPLGGRGDWGLKMLGNICLFAKKEVFLKNLRDEKFSFVYEDLEWSYRARKQWIQLINSEDITIQHWERKKSILARSYIDTPENCYLKTRHRIWFVLRHANWYQKLMFYVCGFWVSNGWTLLYILLYAPRYKWNKLISSRWKGIVDGLTIGVDQ